MIDELDRLREFRAAEPPPSGAAERAARAALADAIARETGRLRQPARRRHRRRFGALVLATAAACAALLVGVLGSGGSPSGPPSAAAAVFERLARVIATQSLTPHRHQYLYVDSRAAYQTHYSDTCITLTPEHRQIWIGANQSGMIRETWGQVAIYRAAHPAHCRAMARGTPGGPTGHNWFAPNCLSLAPTSNWGSLSRNPHVLLRQMRQLDGGPPTPAEDFVHIGDFLRETDAPPSVRATIYRAAALIHGVRYLGWVHDHDGRRGLGFAYTSHGTTAELIFDHQTGELLGEEGTGARGKLQYWAVYLRQRVVNRRS